LDREVRLLPPISAQAYVVCKHWFFPLPPMRRPDHPLAMRRQLLAAGKGVDRDRGVVDSLDAARAAARRVSAADGGRSPSRPTRHTSGVGPGRGAADHRDGPDLQHAVAPVLEEDLEQGGSMRGASVEVPSGKNGSLWRMRPRSNLNHW
jgi:hypothetical protein